MQCVPCPCPSCTAWLGTKELLSIERPVKSGCSSSKPVSRTATRIPSPLKREADALVTCRPHVSVDSTSEGATPVAAASTATPASERSLSVRWLTASRYPLKNSTGSPALPGTGPGDGSAGVGGAILQGVHDPFGFDSKDGAIVCLLGGGRAESLDLVRRRVHEGNRQLVEDDGFGFREDLSSHRAFVEVGRAGDAQARGVSQRPDPGFYSILA